MRIDTKTLIMVRERLHTIDTAILGDVLIEENFDAARAHHYITDADEIIAAWVDAEIVRDEFIEICLELDAAIDALENVAEEYADMLIVTRYRLERAPH